MTEIISPSLYIIIGCMFSGKTTEIIKICKKWESINKKVMCINYKEDIRYGNDQHLYAHNGMKIKTINVLEFNEINMNDIKDVDVILINEAQFFKGLKEFCIKLVEEYKKHVIVSGLDGDFKREPFGEICQLIPICDEVIKLTALCKICNNGTKAIFSKRIIEDKEYKVIDIGGIEKYIPVCRKCYLSSI